MSYDPLDAARDEMYSALAEELYPEHKVQAISEFTTERLLSFYVSHPHVMRPAVDAVQEAKRLQANGHHSAAQVFFVTAIELLLKATLLTPVVHGLVHSESLAGVIVQHALGQAGFERYKQLLAKLFSEIAGLDIGRVRRKDAPTSLLDECTTQQALRNRIIHQGASATPEQSSLALIVSVAVYEQIVHPMISSLGLR